MIKTIAPGCVGHGVSFKEAADAAGKAGFKGYWFDIGGDSKIPAEETKELLAKTGLKAAGFGLPVQFRAEEDAFEADLANLEGLVKYADKIGAVRCATWILPSSDTLAYEENFKLHRDRLKKACLVLKEYGMVLGLEFVGPLTARKGVKYEFIHNLDQMLALCEAIGTGNCGLLLDVWHWDMAGQTRGDFKKFTKEQVALVHINDAPEGIPKDEQMDNVRKMPGATGVLNIAEFFSGLESIGYDGPVLPEPFEPSLAKMSLTEAFKASIDAVNKVWPK